LGDEFKNKLLQSQTGRSVVAIEWSHVFSPQLLNSLFTSWSSGRVTAATTP
jgi:hypothetical protein